MAIGLGNAEAQTHSVLATGDWWRLQVSQTGVYRLTTSTLPALQGVEMERINLYGHDGAQLSTDNSVVDPARLTLAAPLQIDVVDHNGNGIFDAQDELYFYGEGPDLWSYSEADQQWEFTHHAYANTNSYYLTTTSTTAAVRVGKPTPPQADTTLSSYTAVAVVNNDLVNIYKSGQLWMGEKFSASNPSRTFTLTLPATGSNLRLRYAMASKSTAAAAFELSTTGFSRTHHYSSNNIYASTLEAVSGTARTLTFSLRYTPGESMAEGYLDFIELTGSVPLAIGAGQTIVRADHRSARSTGTFTASGIGTQTRIWRVKKDANTWAEEMTLEGNQWTDSLRIGQQYVAFDGGNCLTPTSITSLTNQDLLATDQADYIIITHPTFRQQAERLASLHAINDGLSTLVVNAQQVYNEFSSGKQDPMAIRAFLRWMRTAHPDAPTRYLLLFGKASYDNRDLLGYGLPTVVCYESHYSFDDQGLSFCSDDMLGYLDNNETGGYSQSLDVGIGRLPARTVEEAEHLVDKIEGYIMRRDLQDSTQRGDWRNSIALLADDADPSRPGDTVFAHSSEAVATSIKQLTPTINIDRLFADAYRQQSGAIGSFYPDLNNALRQRINYGCLLLNYIGHGSQKYIGTERYIEPADIEGYTNIDRLPLMVTSTCSYGYHDLPDELCGSELFLNAKGGAVAVISAARPISHIERFNSDVILQALTPGNTIGDALRIAKNRTSVSPCIGLDGDPALRLAMPTNQVVVTAIDGHAPLADGDTATALSQVTIAGEIHDADGNLLSDFDGTIYPIVYDRETRSTTLANDNPGTELSFMQQKSILYKGTAPVSGGRFEYTFTVPRDVPYQYAAGKLSHYAKSSSDDATGCYTKILFGGFNEDVELCEVRPTIDLYLGDTTFRSGGITNPTPTLIATLSDSVGINAFGSGLGHDITATIDGQAGSLIVLNDFYEADIDDPRSGTVRYTLDNIAPGRHTLTLKAWNIWGYSNSKTISFRVYTTDEATFSALTVYPNPANDVATFHYETNIPDQIASAQLQIYSPQGALIYTATPTFGNGSYTVGPIVWRLDDVAPGLYMARILVTTSDGEIHQSTTKCIVR